MSQKALICVPVPLSDTLIFNAPLTGTTTRNQKSRVVVVKPLQVKAGNVTPAEALVLFVKAGGLIKASTFEAQPRAVLTVNNVALQGSSL
jgi:hypothetical protein